MQEILAADSAQSWSPFAGVVYGVRAVGSEEYRYVGMTTATISKRRIQHFKTAAAGKKTAFADWLRARSEREDVFFESLELVMSTDLEDLGTAEQKWIAKLRQEGHHLLNHTDGGLGPTGYVWTDEQRKAAGDRSRGRKFPNALRGPDHHRWGQKASDELRARLSAQRKGMYSGSDNPNFGKFGPDHPSYGRVTSDETRAILSEQKRGEKNPNYGKTMSAEDRAKRSATLKGRPMPSSVRNAHTRHHTNKGVFKETCRHCIDDQNNERGGS